MRDSEPVVRLRPTLPADLDFVLELEGRPDNEPFIGRWSRHEHQQAIDAADREHWILESPASDEHEPQQQPQRLGYLIAYDLTASGNGVYVKRIVVAEKSRGLGRRALADFTRHAVADLGAGFVWLAVRPGNDRAERAYRAVGFRRRSAAEAREEALSRAAGRSPRSRNTLMVQRGQVDSFATERMAAERIAERHLEELCRMHAEEEVMATLGGVHSEAQTREFLRVSRAHWEEYGFGPWILRDDAGRFVGRVSLRHLEVVAGGPEIELGYALRSEFWNRGLATEAARRVVALARERLALRNLVCFTAATNRASARVMEKAGFVYERDFEHAGIVHRLHRLPSPESGS